MALSRGLVHTNQSSVQGPSRPGESPCAGAAGAQGVRSVQEASCLRQRTRPPDHPAWAWPWPGPGARPLQGEGGRLYVATDAEQVGRKGRLLSFTRISKSWYWLSGGGGGLSPEPGASR